MKPVLDFIQRTELKTGGSGARVDFIQRETAISPGMDETAPPDWTKSNEDDALREKTGFDWTKSTIHAINLTRNPVPSWFVIIISFDLIFYMSFGWGEEKRATGEESQKKLPKKGLDPNGFVTGLESSQPHVHFCLCQVESEGRSWLVFAFAFPDWFVP